LDPGILEHLSLLPRATGDSRRPGALPSSEQALI